MPRTIGLAAAFLACSLLVGSATQLLAQEREAGAGKLAAVRVTGSNRYPAETIAAASGLRVGETVRRESFQAAADRLTTLGLFSSVRFRFTSRGEDVELELQVEDAPTVPVWFDNFPWFADNELAQALRAGVGFFDGTAPEQGEILGQMAAALSRLLATRGIQGTVEHELVARPVGEGMMQEFRVVGAALPVSSVEFTDPLAAQDKAVQARLADLAGKPFSRYAATIFAVEHVLPAYLQHGRLRARLGAPIALYHGSPNQPLPGTVVVRIPVEPGPVYHWGGVAWSGNVALTGSVLDRALGLRPGEVADGMKIAAGWQAVQALYGHSGYIEAKVQPEPLYDDAKQVVSYRLAITEGPQYRMGKLVLTGLSVEGERRLRAAWKIAPGDVFDQSYYEEFLKVIVKEAFGDLPVHYDELGHLLEPNPKDKTVDVLLDFH